MVLGTLGWRWLLALSAAPLLLLLLAYPLLPESPQWLVARRHYEAAEAVLRSVAQVNSYPGQLRLRLQPAAGAAAAAAAGGGGEAEATAVGGGAAAVEGAAGPAGGGACDGAREAHRGWAGASGALRHPRHRIPAGGGVVASPSVDAPLLGPPKAALAEAAAAARPPAAEAVVLVEEESSDADDEMPSAPVALKRRLQGAARASAEAFAKLFAPQVSEWMCFCEPRPAAVAAPC